VDIVCSIKNRKGENYKLENFIDHSTGFVSEKFQHGHVIKALELPGLWNGAMALWNTVFVEVPISTFNPVKTVNDLLRPGHERPLTTRASIVHLSKDKKHKRKEIEPKNTQEVPIHSTYVYAKCIV